MKSVTIYTDGACSGNPGPGGWGAVLIAGKHEKHLSGFESETTNNRMELTAVIQALNALKGACSVTLYTDSKYVYQGITEWLAAWKARGWKTAGRQSVKNQDLWEALDREAAKHTVSWNWVKGHADTQGNNLADQLATSAIRENLAE